MSIFQRALDIFKSASSDRARAGGGRVVPLELHSQPMPEQGSSGANVGFFFPALEPMAPQADPSVAGRRLDYAPGWNLRQRPRQDEGVTFEQLRALADGHDLLRIVIETRKDQIANMPWAIAPRDKTAKVEEGTELKRRCDETKKILLRPDREHFWGTWLKSLVEEMLVTDAASIYVRRTVGGDIWALEQLDGATIKRVIDNWGRTPEAPAAAYQQILKGLPTVNYSTQDLLYRPRNVRVHKHYGYSPVEQIIMTVKIALQRQLWQLSYFTDGNLPDSLIGVPSTWTPDQIRQFQEWFDNILTGNTAARRSARFVPGEVAKSYVPTKEAEIFGGAEEWLARVICYCFGVSHQALVKEVNKATAQTAQDNALVEGLAPVMAWVKELVDTILLDILGIEDLEFTWVDQKELDPKVQCEILTAYVREGLMTRNEARAELGLEPDPSPEANILMVGAQLFPLDNQEAIRLKQENMDAFPGMNPDGTITPPEGDDDPEGGPGGGKKDKSSAGAAGAEGEDEGAAKAAAPSSVAKATPSTERNLARRLRASMRRKVRACLRDLGDDVVAQIAPQLRQLVKADETELGAAVTGQMIANQVDLSVLETITDAIAEDIAELAGDSGRLALAQVGVERTEDLVDQVNDRAVVYARDRSAELIGMRRLDDGTLVENPDPRWSINQSTRNMIRGTIVDALEQNLGSDAILEALQDSYAFSAERAEMVVRTEVAMANSEGAMAGYRVAAQTGVSLGKEWLLGHAPCDVCVANAAQGTIPLEQAFQSGHMNTPAHPNCECATTPVVLEDDE